MLLGGLQKCSLVDYPGEVCAIVFTVGCNFRCPYCHNPELVDETAQTISTTQFFDFLRTRTKQLTAVTITGGEPTMHDDLLDFLAEIKQLGFKVKLDTNGTHPAVIEEAQKKRVVDYFAMDIKAPLAMYERTIARPVDVAAIKKSIALLMKGGVPYEFRTTVVKALLSPEDIEQIGREISGASQYYLQRFEPSKLLNPAFRRKTTYGADEFRSLQAMLASYVERCEVR